MSSPEDRDIEPAPAAPPELPGAAELAPDLLDGAVAHINRVTSAHGLRAARELGEYLVETFFVGDLDAALTRARAHVTWRALADREDLLVSHSHLWVCVQLLDQLRRLPEDVGAALPLSHHRRLLVLRDDGARARLAEEAVTQQLTVRELEERVAAQRSEGPVADRRGRKPLPEIVKAIRALRRVELGAELASDEAVGALKAEEADEVIAEIEAQVQALEALRARILTGRAG